MTKEQKTIVKTRVSRPIKIKRKMKRKNSGLIEINLFVNKIQMPSRTVRQTNKNCKNVVQSKNIYFTVPNINLMFKLNAK